MRTAVLLAALASGCADSSADDAVGGAGGAGPDASNPGLGGGGATATTGGGGATATTGGGGATTTAGTGGSDLDAGLDADLDAEVCATGRVTFRITPAPGQIWCGTCPWMWFAIRPVGGEPLAWARPCFGCQDAGCSVDPLGSDGMEVAWDGTYYVPDPCDADPPWSCTATKHCVASGAYVATLVAYQPSGDSCWPAESVTREVTFDWPARTTITWVTGASTDGG
jgi:hypothetical protein